MSHCRNTVGSLSILIFQSSEDVPFPDILALTHTCCYLVAHVAEQVYALRLERRISVGSIPTVGTNLSLTDTLNVVYCHMKQELLKISSCDCEECGGLGGRWDEESQDQWYWCRNCDAEDKNQERLSLTFLKTKVRRVLLLCSYCGDDEAKCSDDFPCQECMGMDNVIEVDESVIREAFVKDRILGGLDYLRTVRDGLCTT